ncbi:Aste57867_252 [Aphanomyces stellatus]|uniref:Aste57867_252 protein n=1 Tax=Aphanomyces stellatus TaxID=120398 RepID=A0A485K735_9STRA|nr:hypothetical protein As57867_000252 [Aphanomyces stellatus]VFT77478.1 Aste57867_252 [Aphanomyces stellatus]
MSSSRIAEAVPFALDDKEEEVRMTNTATMRGDASYDERVEEANAAKEVRVQEAVAAIAKAKELATVVIERDAAELEAHLKAEEDASLAAFRATLEDKRKKKRDAAVHHDEKVIEAVCAASLLEYTERERAEKQLELDEQQRQAMANAKRRELESTTAAARQSKTDAVLHVMELKCKANEAKMQARKAIEEYETKERERQERIAQLAESEAEHELQLQLDAMNRKKEEAKQRRLESEQRAAEAARRAEELRQNAFEAAKKMREAAKDGLEATLAKEEQLREQQYANQLGAVQATKEAARLKREEAERRAVEATRRAEELRNQAVDAARQMRNTSKAGVEAVLAKEEQLREQQYANQLGAMNATKEAATLKREEAERRAVDAARRAEELRHQAVDAARLMRSASKTGMEAVLEKEEQVRAHQFTTQLNVVQAEKDEATRHRLEKEEHALAARARAESLTQAVAAANASEATTVEREHVAAVQAEGSPAAAPTNEPDKTGVGVVDTTPTRVAAAMLTPESARTKKKKCEIM